jgi:hypothetical protein
VLVLALALLLVPAAVVVLVLLAVVLVVLMDNHPRLIPESHAHATSVVRGARALLRSCALRCGAWWCC